MINLPAYSFYLTSAFCLSMSCFSSDFIGVGPYFVFLEILVYAARTEALSSYHHKQNCQFWNTAEKEPLRQKGMQSNHFTGNRAGTTRKLINEE
jgi:hypothetical protein